MAHEYREPTNTVISALNRLPASADHPVINDYCHIVGRDHQVGGTRRLPGVTPYNESVPTDSLAALSLIELATRIGEGLNSTGGGYGVCLWMRFRWIPFAPS